MSFWDLFFHPILRAPTWGTLWMCVASSLMGVLLFLRKRSLLTETLSHAAYPGMGIGVGVFALLWKEGDAWALAPLFLGAIVSSFLGLKVLEWMEKKGGVRTDAALCFVLAVFFGVGVFIASGLQGSFPKWHQAMEQFLFGQAATLRDVHVVLYGGLTLVVAGFLWVFYRPLQALFFDRNYALSLGLKVVFLERAVLGLLLVSLIIGMRSVGVVLMSAMAIAPAVAARQFSDRLSTVFGLAGLFGAFSGLLGNFLSIQLSVAFSTEQDRFSLPTGPMIVLVSVGIAFLALIFAPKRGLVWRLLRVGRFRLRCMEENVLKTLWKKGDLFRVHQAKLLPFVLMRLRAQGWIQKEGGLYRLTADGERRSSQIIRFHRLWELYLTEKLGRDAAGVHGSAEEMEHIMTLDLEERLTKLLGSPKEDPHAQPIPERLL